MNHQQITSPAYYFHHIIMKHVKLSFRFREANAKQVLISALSFSQESKKCYPNAAECVDAGVDYLRKIGYRVQSQVIKTAKKAISSALSDCCCCGFFNKNDLLEGFQRAIELDYSECKRKFIQ